MPEEYFYREPDLPAEGPVPSAAEPRGFEIWRPSRREIVPAGLPLFPFGVWWAFHHAGIFRNREYCLFLIRDHGELVHRSVVTPGYFRFPFMERGDLQIGDVWTSPGHRGKGLAVFAIRKIVEMFARPGRHIWYLVEKNNLSSIKAAEKAGLARYGEGVRKKRFGIALLGYYEMAEKTPDP